MYFIIWDKVLALKTVPIRLLEDTFQGPYEIFDKLLPENYLIHFRDKKKVD